ncbi:MAG: FecCD family ABC transporter permease [Alloprevotella sp.]
MANDIISPAPERRARMAFAAGLLLLPLLVTAALLTGSMRLAPGEVLSALAATPSDGSPAAFIVWQSRVPQIAVALLAGASLSAAGLVMQTLFANPLADPSLLGVNSGASLGAALVLLCGGGALISGGGMIAGFTLTLAAAFLGAMAVMTVLLALSSILRGNMALLIAGVMISFLLSGVISLLNFYATSQGVRSFVIWGLGDFSGVPLGNLPLYAVPVLLTLFALLFLAKPLNAMLLGEEYAHNLGYRVRTVRTLGLLAAGLLAAATTAVCGPVSFIGLAVPHIVRLLYRCADHRLLIPATMLWGGNVALFALLLTRLPGERGALPLAAVTPIIGVPVVFYILTKRGLRG